MNENGQNSQDRDAARKKLISTVFFAMLGVFGMLGVVVVTFFPERAHAVAPILFLMGGLYLALALEVHEGTVKFYPRKRGKTLR
jgi:hypothetical protein